MILEAYIRSEYESQLGGLSEEQLSKLRDETIGLVEWGSRRKTSIVIPCFETRALPRTGLRSGRHCDYLVDLKYWPLEDNNRDILRDLDMKIVSVFSSLKTLGINRPSLVVYPFFFNHIYSKEVSDAFDGNPHGWAGVSLVLSRLNGTSRIATRYDKFDMFNPVTQWLKSGDVVYHHDKLFWRPELVKRGLMRK